MIHYRLTSEAFFCHHAPTIGSYRGPWSEKSRVYQNKQTTQQSALPQPIRASFSTHLLQHSTSSSMIHYRLTTESFICHHAPNIGSYRGPRSAQKTIHTREHPTPSISSPKFSQKLSCQRYTLLQCCVDHGTFIREGL